MKVDKLKSSLNHKAKLFRNDDIFTNINNDFLIKETLKLRLMKKELNRVIPGKTVLFSHNMTFRRFLIG